MTIVRGRADARRLPSRHRFALFRLAALMRLRNAAPRPADVVLFLDRDQNAIDHHAASLWIVLTIACYLAGTLFAAWPVVAALAVSVPLALMAVQFPVAIIGLLTARTARRHLINSVALMSVLILLAVHFARGTSWVRFAAWQFLAVIGLNAIAAVIVFLLRAPIARLEREVIGGAPSAP